MPINDHNASTIIVRIGVVIVQVCKVLIGEIVAVDVGVPTPESCAKTDPSQEQVTIVGDL